MTNPQLNIIPFQNHHQAGIDLLMENIVAEFTETIYSPQTKKIQELSSSPTDRYWVALINDKVIGTIGFTIFKKNSIALKRMFLAKDLRGRGIAEELLKTVIDYAIKSNLAEVWLGTMDQFKAAQNFYEKNGFVNVSEKDLPKDFPANPVDTVFYKMDLKNQQNMLIE